MDQVVNKHIVQMVFVHYSRCSRQRCTCNKIPFVIFVVCVSVYMLLLATTWKSYHRCPLKSRQGLKMNWLFHSFTYITAYQQLHHRTSLLLYIVCERLCARKEQKKKKKKRRDGQFGNIFFTLAICQNWFLRNKMNTPNCYVQKFSVQWPLSNSKWRTFQVDRLKISWLKESLPMDFSIVVEIGHWTNMCRERRKSHRSI